MLTMQTAAQKDAFEIVMTAQARMHLLETSRIVRDEGVLGAMRIAANVASTPAARRHVLEMRSTFRAHERSLCAVAIVASKPSAGSSS